MAWRLRWESGSAWQYQERQRLMLKSGLIAALLAGFACQSAAAGVTHKVKVQVSGTVIVWGEDGALSNFVIKNKGEESRDLIGNSAHVVQTGTLIPVDAPGLAPLLHAGGSFYVASNTAFHIDAEAQGVVSEAAQAAAFDLSVSVRGPAAQSPHSDGLGGGIDRSVTHLADLQTRRTIFRGNQRTAARRGSIADQSVRFDVSLNSGTQLDAPLPPIAVTVYIP